ncbi:hypothetical protein EYZ11_006976 [Aspergillus tanneri]|nr:hypothetical protein EYZ11_006976 [Aspergillus tanneri]
MDGAPKLSESLSESDSTLRSEMGTLTSSKSVVSPTPKPRHVSNILDSHLDDIDVPILQPEPTKRVPVGRKTKELEDCAGKLQMANSAALLDDALDNLMIPVLEPKRVSPVMFIASPTKLSPKDLANAFCLPLGKKMARAVVSSDGSGLPKVIPWDGTIHWALKGCSVFDNYMEERQAFTYRPNILSQQPVNGLWMFQYGVRYIPSVRETNCYRTVRIEDLPASMTLNQVLAAIQGEIYCARLLNTQPITGSNTAIITFIFQVEAIRFLKASKQGLQLGLVAAKVIPVHTPTYPIPADMERMIFKEGYRRCLCVSGERGIRKEVISQFLMNSPHANFIESVQNGHVSDEVHIHFHSVKTAAAAYTLLKGHPIFFDYKFRFLRPLRLLKPAPLRSQSPAGQPRKNPRIGI